MESNLKSGSPVLQPLGTHSALGLFAGLSRARIGAMKDARPAFHRRPRSPGQAETMRLNLRSRVVVMAAWKRVFFAFLLLLLPATESRLLGADPDVCAVCGKPIVDVYYTMEDHVTLEKRHVCRTCEQSYPVCFVCGLPADTNATGFAQLSDQRVLCARDSKSAVLREEEGLRDCREVRDGLDRLFSRFTSFPETNVTVRLMDRVRLLEVFRLAGNDYQCPNVWGITQPRTNGNQLHFDISLMTGLPLSWFQATCAHEYGHTWVAEHLVPARKDNLSREAEEGFCELVAYLYMDSLNNEAQKALILRNAYTRGQIDLFVAAVKTYGFNDILDWMQFGTDDRLSASEPGRIRRIAEHPTRLSRMVLTRPGTMPEQVPAFLTLKAVFWDPKQPSALINNRRFQTNQERTVRVGATNIVVRCLAISQDSVRVRVAGSAQERTLWLK